MNGDDFRQLTQRKTATLTHLIEVGEWELAAYLMGYILECALKAASCKTLRLSTYPPFKSKDKEALGFKTHEFDQLLVVSGLSDLFGGIKASLANDSWSSFTVNYPSNWTEMRYSDTSNKFDEKTVKELAKKLYDGPNSILETIKRENRW